MKALRQKLQQWHAAGDPFVWLSAAAVTVSLFLVCGLLLLIAMRGLGHFWPHTVWQMDYQWQGEQQQLLGSIQERSRVPVVQLQDNGIGQDWQQSEVERWLFKVGNRDLTGVDFRSVLAPLVQSQTQPLEATVIQRQQFGNFYGFVVGFQHGDESDLSSAAAWQQLPRWLAATAVLREQVSNIERHQISRINYLLKKLDAKQRDAFEVAEPSSAVIEQLQLERIALQQQLETSKKQLVAHYQVMNAVRLVVRDVTGRQVALPMSQVLQVYQPNKMSLGEKLQFYGRSVWQFLASDPRESNTEGGVFPAIFGTVMMVLIMSVVVMPLGVIAAVYLREYARDGWFVRLVRIGVNNLAGVPSIVYGVFGLGFFVYFVGQNVDQWFYQDVLPAPTFGTPGILWASLTLALLTLPVVIVSTEEGLARVPLAIREGSLALGATRTETLWRIVLPVASPAMMTGLILAIARAAGEVAPLMLVGVVKFAPSLPLDGNFPYLHLERQFMHLGYHIYEVGFQSSDVEAVRPLVYATALLLVVVIVVLNLAAIIIRNRLRRRYRTLQ